jgi:putative transposase
MRTEIVLEALQQASATRSGQLKGTVFHTDRGSQFSDAKVVEFCASVGLVGSMGATGTCFDHASAESFGRSSSTSTSTADHLHHHRRAASRHTRYINFYNHQRRCAKAGNLSPIRYELSSSHVGPQAR